MSPSFLQLYDDIFLPHPRASACAFARTLCRCAVFIVRLYRPYLALPI